MAIGDVVAWKNNSGTEVGAIDQSGNLVVAGAVTGSAGAVYQAGGTDVAVVDGGTGASTAAGARTNLGLVIGTHVASQTEADAIVAENTDVEIPVDLTARTDVSGTWTHSRTAAATYRVRRTAGASIDVCAMRAYPRNRTTASKGFKPTGVRIVYAVSTADINDITVAANFTVAPATGSAVAAATSLGTITYDSSHDSTAKRKSSSTGGGNHTLVATFGTPVYLGSPIVVEFVITVDGSASGVLDILGVELLGSETLVDAA